MSVFDRIVLVLIDLCACLLYTCISTIRSYIVTVLLLRLDRRCRVDMLCYRLLQLTQQPNSIHVLSSSCSSSSSGNDLKYHHCHHHSSYFFHLNVYYSHHQPYYLIARHFYCHYQYSYIDNDCY